MKAWFVFLPFPKQQILDSSKLKQFADNNFNFENGGKFSKKVEKTLWKKEKFIIASSFSFPESILKRLVLQTHKNKGWVWWPKERILLKSLWEKEKNAGYQHFLLFPQCFQPCQGKF